MLLISEKNLLLSDEMDQKYKISEALDVRKYRVADTSLTYRQVNALSDERMIPEERNNIKKWRKFSTREAIYLAIVHELRKYGLNNNQLTELRASFFKPNPTKQEIIKNPLESIGENTSDVSYTSIILALCGQPIYILINSEFQFNFVDTASLRIQGETSSIVVNLKSIVDSVIGKEEKTNFLIEPSIPITEKEVSILSMLRNNTYKEVKITKKNGELYTAKCKMENEFKEPDNNILSIIKSKDYADIELTKRDGKVVHLSINESFKF